MDSTAKEHLQAGEILKLLKNAIKKCENGEEADVLVSSGFRIFRIAGIKTEKMMGGEKIIFALDS